MEVRVPTQGTSDARGACKDPTYGGEDPTRRAGPTGEERIRSTYERQREASREGRYQLMKKAWFLRFFGGVGGSSPGGKSVCAGVALFSLM